MGSAVGGLPDRACFCREAPRRRVRASERKAACFPRFGLQQPDAGKRRNGEDNARDTCVIRLRVIAFKQVGGSDPAFEARYGGQGRSRRGSHVARRIHCRI